MADLGGDQAAGLRRLFGRDLLRVVNFAAGSAGVGKSTAVANLAVALARLGKEVLVLDESAPGGGVSAQFGARTRFDLLHVVNRERMVSEVMVPVAPGVNVLPAARAVKKLGRLSAAEQRAFIEGLSGMERPADVVLVDASADHPLGFSPLGLVAQDNVIVVAANSTAITEAYALIKKVSLGYARRHFRILVSRAKSAVEAEAIHANIARVSAERGLARLEYAGHIPSDDMVAHAVRLCQPVVQAYPEAPTARAFRSLADDFLHWPMPVSDCGGLEQFIEQLLHLSQRITPSAIHAG